MSNHLRHCPKHKKPLPCPHCALVSASAQVPPTVPVIDAPAPVVREMMYASNTPTPVKRKRGRPPKGERAFAGLVGREKSIVNLGNNKYSNVKISSGDLDPGAIRDPLEDFVGNGDWFINDPVDRDQDTKAQDAIATAAGEFGYEPEDNEPGNPGFEIIHVLDPVYTVPRHSTPWWIRTRALKLFLTGPVSTWKDGRPSLSAALDYEILYEFYICRSSDRDILSKFFKSFVREADGKKSFTSTENAVKNRRLRVTKMCSEKFDANETPDRIEVGYVDLKLTCHVPDCGGRAVAIHPEDSRKRLSGSTRFICRRHHTTQSVENKDVST